MQELITVDNIKQDFNIFFLYYPRINCEPNGIKNCGGLNVKRASEWKYSMTIQKENMRACEINNLNLYKVCLYLNVLLPQIFKPKIFNHFVYQRFEKFDGKRYIHEQVKSQITIFTFNEKIVSFLDQKELCFCYNDDGSCFETKQKYVNFFKLMIAKTQGLGFEEYIDSFYKETMKQLYGGKNGGKI